ncbi:acylphosphatase [Halomonas sp. 18H]|uniref:acylphosphatase n=1 Tax=Halomonas almeriensis TaxID=308163 RepID=UPI0022319B2D|nr:MULTISPECIES: acylphosphatase [Halomonas]MCW4151832.1 acylphosphatase [Halomonas sp. 18H]MDN3554078.1 acylphosphatase [Halomonas almeriensis]
MLQSQCVKALVSGRVQGVCFRQATREQALIHGVVGYAHNLPDGRVEVLMCGDAESVKALGDWLWQGPPAAEVRHVELQTVEASPPDNFRTG